MTSATSDHHLPNLPAWYRLLPKPPTGHNLALRRTSSLAQHHLFRGRSPTGHASPQDGAPVHMPDGSNHAGPTCEEYIEGPQKPANGGSASASPSRRGRSLEMAETQAHPGAVRKSSNPRENICLCPASPKIPRPRNSFILFRQHQQASIIAQNPGIPNPEVSKIIGEQWRGLSAEAKEEWNLLAEEEKARHQQQYPGYRYHPRRNGRVSNQSSLSGPSSAESQESCAKCGGKPMNYYTNITPVYTPPASTTRQTMAVTVPAKRGYVVSAAPPGSRIHGQQALSPEHVTFQRVDPRLVYAVPPPSQTLPTPPSAESQDAKRRRFNNNGVYLPTREVYPEASYSYAHSPTGSGVYTRQEVLQHPQQIPVQHVQLTKPQMVSPPRAAYPRPPQLQPIRPPLPHQRNRSSVALPPIETMVTQTPVKTPSTQSQSSGVEAMIMSIPVLNKIKVLSQISGPLPAPGITSPKPEVRGAVIAVEGMDAASVQSMTNSLAEQLEKEGKFAVRIFGGPDPYSMMRDAKAISKGGKKGGLTPDTYLEIMSLWHKINKDMVDYITSRPGSGSKSSPIMLDHKDEDYPMTEAEDHQEPPVPSEKTLHVQTASQSSSSIQEIKTDQLDSAISPKTISKAADMSIKSPPVNSGGHKGRSQSTPGLWAHNELAPAELDTRAKQPLLTFPRPLNSKRIPPPPDTPPPSTPPPPALPSSRVWSRIPPPLPVSSVSRPATVQPTATTTSTSTTSCTNSNIAMPIAIVPHFQLTTVDASSISMPINDGFSPPAHWQWFATLWRGSVGPDITIIIRGVDEEPAEGVDVIKQTPIQNNHTSVVGGAHGAGRDRIPSVASSQSHTSGTGVEIRLHDSRAVIVKTGIAGSNGSSALNMAPGEDARGTHKTLTGAQQAKEMENWEKAKRRVGFEVEEFLRR